MKRTALRRGKPLPRKAWLRSSRRRARVLGAVDAWRDDLGACIVCPAEGRVCSGQVQGHHVIARQALRRRGLQRCMSDLRNRVPVCEHRHEQHTTGYRPIPRAALPASVFEFAKELGLSWYLDRFYPAEEAA